MAIVVDAARDASVYGRYNTTYQKGNDNANTPNATWLACAQTYTGTVETPCTFAYSPPVDNTADAWNPKQNITTFLNSTPATVRP